MAVDLFSLWGGFITDIFTAQAVQNFKHSTDLLWAFESATTTRKVRHEDV